MGPENIRKNPFDLKVDNIRGINKRSGRSVLYDRTGLSTIRTLIKTGFKILICTKVKLRSFVDALVDLKVFQEHWDVN